MKNPVSGTKEVSENGDDPETAEDPVPAPGKVMDDIDLLRRFSGAYVGTKDALNALASYEKSGSPMLTKRKHSKKTAFFARK